MAEDHLNAPPSLRYSRIELAEDHHGRNHPDGDQSMTRPDVTGVSRLP
jgi:hypothetical protein